MQIQISAHGCKLSKCASGVQEFPIRSKLKEFGCPVSAITAKHIEDKLDGLSVDEVNPIRTDCEP